MCSSVGRNQKMLNSTLQKQMSSNANIKMEFVSYSDKEESSWSRNFSHKYAAISAYPFDILPHQNIYAVFNFVY